MKARGRSGALRRRRRRHRSSSSPLLPPFFLWHRLALDVRPKQAQPMSKRQKVKEREKRRKERLMMGKDKLCYALAEGRTCPHGERCPSSTHSPIGCTRADHHTLIP